jgi:hypothetical protein
MFVVRTVLGIRKSSFSTRICVPLPSPDLPSLSQHHRANNLIEQRRRNIPTATQVTPTPPHPPHPLNTPATNAPKSPAPQCVRCGHTKCSECPRAPIVKVEPAPDPEVLRSVEAKLAKLNVGEPVEEAA